MKKHLVNKVLMGMLFMHFHFALLGQFEPVQKVEFTQADGLPVTGISNSFIDSKGFYWFTSGDGGLYRFDGVTFKEFPSFTKTFAGRIVPDILEDKTGVFWILSSLYVENDNQLHLFDSENGKIVTLKEYLETKIPFDDKNVKQIIKNRDGSIWVILNDSRIYEFFAKNYSLWTSSIPKAVHSVVAKVTSSSICALIDENGTRKIAFIDSKGQIIKKTDGSKYNSYSALNTFQSDPKSKSYYFYGKELEKTGLVKFSLKNKMEVIDSVSGLRVEGKYQVWGDYFTKKLKDSVQLFSKNFKYLFSVPLKNNNNLELVDKQGGIWVSHKTGTLTRYHSQENRFKIYSNSLYNKPWYTSVRGIAVGKDNDLFTAQGSALVHTGSNGRHTILKPSPEKSMDPFGCIIQKDYGNLWISIDTSLYALDPQTKVFKKRIESDGSGRIWQPYEDRNSKIWLGTRNGLFYLSQDQNTIIRHQTTASFKAIDSSSIFGFYENNKGMWIASSKGIFQMGLNGKLLNHFHEQGEGKNRLAFNVVTYLQEDDKGWFWVSTKGGGLIQWNPATGEQFRYTTKNGLKDNTIYGCYLDDYGKLWMSSNNGLMRFDIETKEVVHFTEKEGIPNLEFNTISHYKDKEGRLYFGGVKGTTSFHPKDLLKLADWNAPIHLTEVSKQNEKGIEYYQRYTFSEGTTIIRVKPSDRVVNLFFSQVDFNGVKRTSYAYKIKGLDEQWLFIKEPKIVLKGIPYGEYELELRAQYPGQPWKLFNNNIRIIVSKPFYLQLWFILSSIIILIIGIIAFLRWRTQKILAQKQKLESIIKERTLVLSEQTQKLKLLDEKKTQFFANISHELRTPATLIAAPLQDIKSKIAGTPSQTVLSKNINIIDRNAKKMLHLIEEILDLSKLNAGKINLKEQSVNLKNCIKQIMSAFESTAEVNQINFRLDFQLSIHKTFLLDNDKFEKILNNFLLNAFKFTSNNGEIIIEVKEVDENIQLAVKDSGIGIHEEELPFVFERFYQSKEQDRGMYGGTGIGLSICKEMAHLMNGEVWAESIINKGSSFFLKIPKNEAATNDLNETFQSETRAIENELIKTPSPARSKDLKTIMLVEDNPDMSSFIISLLEEFYNIVHAKNGIEGIQALNEHPCIDLILSDVMMPMMDGFTLLKKVKENTKWRNLPMIMLTARAAEEDKLNAFTLDVDDYIMKPFSTDELIIRIGNLLKNYENRNLWKQNLLAIQHNTDKNVPEEDIVEPEVSIQDLKWMKKVELFINKGIKQEVFNVEILASELTISKRHFERKTKKITGLSPAKLITEVRLQQARELLEKGTYSTTSEVCYAIGLETPSYFTKLYLERYGRKPSSYFK